MESRWEIKRYSDGCKDEWDDFVRDSRNGTFLFMRGYMDYHADRFADFSLMAYRDGRLHALLPAHCTATEFCSHRGLTYGGVVTDEKMTAALMLELFGGNPSLFTDVYIGRQVDLLTRTLYICPLSQRRGFVCVVPLRGTPVRP